jgi:hypothetical protein
LSDYLITAAVHGHARIQKSGAPVAVGFIEIVEMSNNYGPALKLLSICKRYEELTENHMGRQF